MRALLLAGMVAFGWMGTAKATVIESFETGSFSSGWTQNGSGNAATFLASYAHDGSYGGNTNAAFWYNTSVAIGLGDTLSAWVHPNGSGRTYLGFGASAAGASSFVIASNTGAILFQNNDSYGFASLNSTAVTFSNIWYLATVTFNLDGSVLGQLFGSDGVTLLASETAVGLNHGVTGGVALRNLNSYADTISVNSATAIPEPPSLALLGMSLAGVMAASRRRAI